MGTQMIYSTVFVFGVCQRESVKLIHTCVPSQIPLSYRLFQSVISN